jgi:diphthamide biosynthesis protein 3
MAAATAIAAAATATAAAATAIAAAATTTLQDPTKPFSMSDIDDDDSSDDEGDGVYDEIPLSDMTFLEEEQKYTYPCPCGDLFELFVEDLDDGEDIAYCPSCSLKIRVLS